MTCGTNPFGGPLEHADENQHPVLSLVLEPSPEPEPSGSPVPAQDTAPGSDAGSRPGSGTGSEVVLAEPLPGREMTLAELVIAFLAQRAKRLAHNVCQPGWIGELGRDWVSYKPETMAQHKAYVKSGAWVPKGYEDSWIRKAGVAYGLTVGRAGKAAGKTIVFIGLVIAHLGKAVDGTSERQSRFTVAFLVALAIFLIVVFTR